MATNELHTVRMSDGCSIKAKILADAPNKALMIALHGAPGLSSHVEAEASYGDFADIFRVLVFDMRGCGDSDQQRPFTRKQWVQDVDELSIYGILAGDTTAQLAHWCIANCMKEALTDPRVQPDPEQVPRILTGRSKDQEDLGAAIASLGPLYEVPPHVGHQPEVNVGEVMARAIKPFYETHNAAYDHEMSRYDLRDRLPTIKVPAFTWAGRYDWITPLQPNEEIARGLGNLKQFVIYDNSGHVPALEEKTKFQKDARQFLSRLEI